MTLDASGPLAAVLALAEVILPFWAGWRSGRDRSAAWRVAMAMIVVAVGFVAVPVGTPYAMFDALWVACAGALGLAVAGWSRREVGRLAAGVVIFLVFAEVLGRFMVVAAPAPAPGWKPKLRVVQDFRVEACALAFPDSPWGPALTPPVPSDGRPAVLHLGDSMLVFGPTEPGVLVVDRLDARDPARQHVRLAVAGVGLGTQRAFTEAWIDDYPTEKVVVHTFLGNDLSDRLRPPPCCVVEDASRPCSGPRVPWWSSWATPSQLAITPEPLPWAVLRQHASVARAAADVFGRWLAPGGGHWEDDAVVQADETLYEQLLDDHVATLAGLREVVEARGATLEVIVLPFGPDEEKWRAGTWTHGRQRADDLVARVQALGVPVVDLGLPLAQLDGELYLSDGFHLDREGHAAVADALAQHWGMPPG